MAVFTTVEYFPKKKLPHVYPTHIEVPDGRGILTISNIQQTLICYRSTCVRSTENKAINFGFRHLIKEMPAGDKENK